MKLSAAVLFLSSVGSASAFLAGPAAKTAAAPAPAVGMSPSDRDGVGFEVKNVVRAKDVPAGTINGADNIYAPQMTDGPASKPMPKRVRSKAIPFMDVAPCMDGSMAGDVGFDPLGFAGTKEDLMKYREAEIRHGRLAMLAAAGWPLSELWDVKIANALGMDPLIVAENGFRAPSVLNGGMGLVSPIYWFGCLLLAGAVEALNLTYSNKKEGYFPGNLGFDPLGLYPTGVGSEKGQKWMQNAEIKNGRLAMIAITAFAAQEFVTHEAIVHQVPIFFQPIWQTLSEMGPEPYYIPPPEEAWMEPLTREATSAVDGNEAAAAMRAAVDATLPATAESTTSAAAAATDTAASAASVSPEVALPLETPIATPPTAATISAETTSSVEELAVAKKRIAELEELTAAKERIVELEKKLAAINSLAQ